MSRWEKKANKVWDKLLNFSTNCKNHRNYREKKNKSTRPQTTTMRTMTMAVVSGVGVVPEIKDYLDRSISIQI